jgi:hypothetical protein
MKAPSKRMPTLPVRKAPWSAWGFLGMLIVGCGILAFHKPQILLLIAVIGSAAWLGTICDTRFRRHLALSRANESICDFARTFDRKRLDPWIIRAVYEELSRFLSVDGKPTAIRAKDRCEKDLRIDPDDLADLAQDIALRAGLSMDSTKQNPYFGKIHTVGDLVAFLEHQPHQQDKLSGFKPKS